MWYNYFLLFTRGLYLEEWSSRVDRAGNYRPGRFGRGEGRAFCSLQLWRLLFTSWHQLLPSYPLIRVLLSTNLANALWLSPRYFRQLSNGGERASLNVSCKRNWRETFSCPVRDANSAKPTVKSFLWYITTSGAGVLQRQSENKGSPTSVVM